MNRRPLAGAEQHPPFLGGGIDPTPPPYDFEGVVLRYFPLKANFQALASFCDDYLNIAPDFAYFRPTAPFVLLMVVNYGRMSQQLGNLGWTSQNELLFTIPIDWYRTENGKLVFHSMATVAPFIFVDNDSSQSAGREILGWPKVPGWFSRGLDSWAAHPRNRREVLTLTTRVFDELYEGDALRPRELLVIEEDPDPSFTEFPPNLKNPLNPLVSIPKGLLEWSKLGVEGLETLLRLPLRGYSESVDRRFLERIRMMMRAQNGLATTFQGNTINIKQMRDASNPLIACYQAITNAKLQVSQFYEGGMLGDSALLRGDLSGGYRIRIHDYESQPIISALGLETERSERLEEEAEISYLRPVLPFWQKMDMRYLQAENVCWRTRELGWRTNSEELDPDSERAQSNPNLFNTTGPAALQVATGPFRFLNTTIRVLPLLADSARLEALVAERLPEVDGAACFEAYGRYVYLVITNYGQMRSESNDIGRWADRVVEFAVPVRWRDRRNGKLVSVGYFCPFVFNNSAIGVTTGREVYGWPVTEAQILSPRNVWLGENGPVANVTPRVDLKAQVFPALGVGQESDWRTLIEVDDGQPIDAGDRSAWTSVADSWGRQSKQELQRMSAQADNSSFLNLCTLALEILGNGKPLNQFSFKQIRDAEFTDQACYQALVRRPMHIERLHDIREMEDRTHVKIHRYPTHPIVDELGLVKQYTSLTDASGVDFLQPSRHFFLRADLRTEVPENICKRSIDKKWTIPRRSPGYFEQEGVVELGADLTRFLNDPQADIDPNPFRENKEDTNPLRINHKCKIWREAAIQQKDSSLCMTRADAAKVVDDDTLEPQMVVHTMLSNEWENHGDARWQQAKRQSARGELAVNQLPTFVIRRDSVGAACDELFPDAETVKNVGTDDNYWSPTKRGASD